MDEETAAIAKLKGQVAAIRAGGDIAEADTPLHQPVAYWRSTEAVAPVAEAKSVGLPMLVLQGAQDIQVVDADWQRWKAGFHDDPQVEFKLRSEEHTSELQSLMRVPYAVFCLKKKQKPP